MAIKDALDRVPYWRALAIALMGATILIWLQGTVAASITSDNQRDDDKYAPKSSITDVRERLVRIETLLERVLDKK